MFTRRTLLGTGAAAAAMLPMLAHAQGGESQEEKRERQRREDWPWLGRYAEDNARLKASGQRVDIVFMGDSITEGWPRKQPAFWTPGRVCRGISGQTTPQMVLRMMADVVMLKPRLVHIMAGTNDVAGNTGKITVPQTCDNLAMMATLARANGIEVLMASVPPADGFPWRQGIETVEPIRAINRWIAEYSRAGNATFVDYTPAMATASGAMKPGLADDGVHPTEAGYEVMAGVLTPILRARGA